MTVIPYVVAYLATGVFFVAVIARFIIWARMPMHLRWELYPVAHEAKRAHYGGSYLEESEWWNKPRTTSLWGELKAMLLEILFLVALRENNPKLWLRSFPFHFGLYLVIGCSVLMAAQGILASLWSASVTSGLGTFFYYTILISGVGGLCLGVLGALGLLHQRLTAPELRDFTTPADIFNLVFFLAAFGCALLTFVLVDPDFSSASFLMRSLVTFQMASLPGSGLEVILPMVTVVLMSLLMAYIPLTHMSHFVGKYFAYHSIRWNDKPNLRGGEEEATIEKLLSQPVSWQAPHIRADGQKNWVEVATDIATEEKK